MNTLTIQTLRDKAESNSKSLRQRLSDWGMTSDVLMIGGLIVVFNIFLLATETVRSLIFLPGEVEAGQWWRLIVYPFVHVSWYHLLLDAGAFLLLYAGIENKNIFHRLTHVFLCSAASLIAAWMFSPSIHEIGLCGLSGVAHGLMMVSALEMMRNKADYKIGFICMVMVVSKSIYEVITGYSLLSFLLFNMCGTPMVACHAGGVIGGMLSFGVIGWINKNKNATVSSPVTRHTKDK
jgi:rhomboid family GlyGly-CTERM serine protease